MIFFLHMRHVFLRPGVISLRRKMTPRSIFDGGRYSSLHLILIFGCTEMIWGEALQWRNVYNGLFSTIADLPGRRSASGGRPAL